MCYYNGQKVTRAEFIELMQIERSIKNLNLGDKPVQNGFDYGPTAVLKPNDVRNNFDVTTMEWGFIPSYLKTREDVKKMRFGYQDANGKFRPGLTTLNAKGEEMLQPGKMFREAGLKRRCLILSSGFFEWQHIFPKNKRTGEPLKTAVKYPYYISVAGQEYFYMAGIWNPWTDQVTGEHVDSVAIVTTEANKLMSQVHNSKNRMPTILPDELAWEWMMEDISEDRITELATNVFQTEKMQACTIEKDFRASIEPTKPFSYQDLPALVF
jgi:putative SOS response-associated peptidase YedK